MDPAPNTPTLRQPGPGPLDYLILGHVTLDHAQPEPRLGGTGAYAGLTAHALGLRVGLVTSCRADLDLSELSGLAIERQPSERTTTFENTGHGRQRRQVLTDRADDLDWESIPAAWRSAPIVHLAPVAGEVDPAWAAAFPGAFVGLTPQGWWRIWDWPAAWTTCRPIWPSGIFPTHRPPCSACKTSGPTWKGCAAWPGCAM